MELSTTKDIRSLLHIDSIQVLDMYLAIHDNELDFTDWVFLLTKLDKSKVEAISYIHSWTKYNFDPTRYGELLDYAIFDKDRFRGYRNLQKFSYQELLLFLSKTIRLEWYEEDKDYPDDLFLTEDKVFLVYKKDKDITDTLYNKAISVINLFYLEDMKDGRKLCIDTMATNHIVQEEEVLKARNYELELLGIRPYEEVLDIYHYENPNNILKKMKKKLNNKKQRKYAVELSTEYPAFVKEFAITDFFNIENEATVKSLRSEFYTILNSIIVYNDVLRYGKRSINETIKRSLSYLNLGINISKKSLTPNTAELLSYVKLSELFRLGFSTILELKKYASTINAIVAKSPKTILLTPDDSVFLENITKAIPTIKWTVDSSSKPIQSTDDVLKVKQTLDSILNKLTN